MMEALPSGIPWGVYLLSLVLSGGIGAAILQYLGVRATTKANLGVNAADSRLKDVTALGDALTSLGAENERLVKRLDECREQNDELQAELHAAHLRLRGLGAGP